MPRFPFTSFPDGWFQAAFSDELVAGGVLPLRLFGKDLALFRARSGAAALVEAACPHLGASLALGCVDHEGLRCPLHGWKFNASGACVEAQGGKPIPPGAATPAFPLVERDGLILVYHDRRGRAPSFQVPVIPELSDRAWAPLLRKRWTIRTHCQEPLENLVDGGHFEYLHKSPSRPQPTLTTDGPFARSRATVSMRRPSGEPVTGAIEWDGYGMGFGVVRLRAETEVLFLNAVTPVDEETVDARLSFTWRLDGPRGLGESVARDIERQVREDIPIWETRSYRPQPLLTEGEAPIMALRRWCRQFMEEVA